MITKEQEFYINALKDYLWGKKTEPIDDLDWNVLNNLAKSQNTNGIVFYQCQKFIPKEYYSRFNSLYMSEIYNYGLRVNYTNEITNLFKKNDINYFIVKGLEMSKYYQIPALRTMGDSDFVVEDDKKDKAYLIAEKLGYEFYEGGNEKVYIKNNIEIEIHHKLLYNDDSNKEIEIKFFDDMFDHVKDNQLDCSYHFIFLIDHLKKHILNMGCGFRQFMDLAVFASKEKLDWQYINTSLEKLNLLKFKNICMALIYRWFDYKFEDVVLNLDEEFYQESTQTILKNGVHGWDNKENELNLLTVSMNNSKGEKGFKQKISYLLTRYFPSYEKMKDSSTYGFVNNRRYLMPIAWLYRFLLAIKHNKAKREALKTLKNLFISKDEVNKRLDTLDKWGL